MVFYILQIPLTGTNEKTRCDRVGHLEMLSVEKLHIFLPYSIFMYEGRDR